MRISGKFLTALGVAALAALAAMPVVQAAESVDAASERVALQELSAKLASGQQSSSYSCPVGPGGGGGAGADSAKTVAAAVNAYLTPERMREMSQKWKISTKNLPPGSYRERCFGCLTQPGEEGGRVLNCVCPVKSGTERLTVNLDTCKAGEEITYCADMLICGKCMYTESASAGNSANDALLKKMNQDTDMILKSIEKVAQ